MQLRRTLHRASWWSLGLLAPFAEASDLYRIGASPASQGMASVSGLARDALSAMSANPAYLADSGDSMQLSLETFYVDAGLQTKTGERVRADEGPVLVPEFALSRPLNDYGLTLGAAVKVMSGMQAKFNYVDPPGTLGVTYGQQPHESEYAAVTGSVGLGWQATPNLALGASIGLTWNRNRLKAPYIFQSHPALAGLKVLVDLEVEDYAPTAMVGLDYALNEATSFNLSYGLENDFAATGDLKGNLAGLGLGIQPDFRYDTRVDTGLPAFLSAGMTHRVNAALQLGLGIQPDFRYDARVDTGLPAFLSAGMTHRVNAALQLGLQVDWINWKRTFEDLPITLTDGNNAELNAFLGSTSIRDTAPLDWDNQVSTHLGMQYQGTNRLWRAGYEYSTPPVPTRTMTPMTGAIFRHAVSAGTTAILDGANVDLYYRFSTSGGSTAVNDSQLLGGEHNGYELDLKLHSVGIAIHF